MWWYFPKSSAAVPAVRALQGFGKVQISPWGAKPKGCSIYLVLYICEQTFLQWHWARPDLKSKITNIHRCDALYFRSPLQDLHLTWQQIFKVMFTGEWNLTAIKSSFCKCVQHKVIKTPSLRWPRAKYYFSSRGPWHERFGHPCCKQVLVYISGQVLSEEWESEHHLPNQTTL